MSARHSRRMASFTAWLAASLLLAPAIAAAQDAAAAANSLEALDWLVGGWWVAETPGAPDGVRAYELEYEWGDSRRLIRYRLRRITATDTLPGTEGMTWWDPEQRRIALVEIDPAGHVTRGTIATVGDTLRIDEVMSLVGGGELPVRTEMTRVGPHAIDFAAFAHQNGEWRRVLSWRFERRPGTPP